VGAGRLSESGGQTTEKRESTVESQDEELATRLAGEAGRMLMELRSGFSGDRTALAKAGDRRSHEHLVAEISRYRPADAIVSEEDDESQRPWPRPARQWVIDPLDGTREYSETRSDFAVHVALVVDGTAQIGAVALPGEGLTLASGAL
jgi:3'(2'), 5'-bisphosphate nucleotidase